MSDDKQGEKKERIFSWRYATTDLSIQGDEKIMPDKKEHDKERDDAV